MYNIMVNNISRDITSPHCLSTYPYKVTDKEEYCETF